MTQFDAENFPFDQIDEMTVQSADRTVIPFKQLHEKRSIVVFGRNLL
jgi:hypothetical protein